MSSAGARPIEQRALKWRGDKPGGTEPLFIKQVHVLSYSSNESIRNAGMSGWLLD
jgi:hypothetical protein